MDQRLIGPGMMKGCGHVHVPVCQDEEWPLETAEGESWIMNQQLLDDTREVLQEKC